MARRLLDSDYVKPQENRVYWYLNIANIQQGVLKVIKECIGGARLKERNLSGEYQKNKY